MSKFIEPYRPKWKCQFDQIKNELEYALLDLPCRLDIQHVGSTAVAGLWAKPILDIDIILERQDQLNEVSFVLGRLGYNSRGDQGIPGRYAFRQSSEHTPLSPTKKSWPDHHLYVCLADSLALKNHLFFRDALRRDPYLAEQYSKLKRSLADQSEVTRPEYMKRKTEFILSVLSLEGLNSRELEEIRKANL